MPSKINLPPGVWTKEQQQDITQELADRIGFKLAGMSRQLGGVAVLKEGRSGLGSNERRPVV